MEFEILVSKFRKLHAVIFGLADSEKTRTELKEEFLVLEAKIKDEVRRDGALPNQLIQKIYDDFGKVRAELELTTTKATEDKVVEEIKSETKTKVEVEETTEETETKAKKTTKKAKATE